ncbi:hypothetical protein ADK78_10630 [Kitasatospora aureofaciens]|nr:hypothetical protein DF17_28100 [Streptomyces rimosus]KOG76511.1 hypothetical protein ADK78_10630 [Kitasatospora aureofaciens]KOT41167.1 hypothetical protein ADK84_12370 [Streptomyces sp. NRRL WC-3701]KOT68282.1 hypothetical protein ADK44_01910 [Streptomyces rimosus subsp. rimosus]KEF21205.1 hypothetical protein DF18_08405 [Streptomyces rimosus]
MTVGGPGSDVNAVEGEDERGASGALLMAEAVAVDVGRSGDCSAHYRPGHNAARSPGGDRA